VVSCQGGLMTAAAPWSATAPEEHGLGAHLSAKVTLLTGRFRDNARVRSHP
jgi:hypothetical protein